MASLLLPFRSRDAGEGAVHSLRCASRASGHVPLALRRAAAKRFRSPFANVLLGGAARSGWTARGRPCQLPGRAQANPTGWRIPVARGQRRGQTPFAFALAGVSASPHPRPGVPNLRIAESFFRAMVRKPLEAQHSRAGDSLLQLAGKAGFFTGLQPVWVLL